MFTSYDKAIAAVLNGLLYFATNYFGLPISPDLLVALMPILVYFIPNKAA
jgi:hypothetical protein